MPSRHPAIIHEPDPDHPGWWTWVPADAHLFNASIGKLLVRPEAPGRARCRMFPGKAHSNIGEAIHGGAILAFIDMALFAGASLSGADVAFAVTLDCNVHFLLPGRPGEPLDAEVELLRESGRLVFLRGTAVQGGDIVASFSATLRKMRQ